MGRSDKPAPLLRTGAPGSLGSSVSRGLTTVSHLPQGKVRPLRGEDPKSMRNRTSSCRGLRPVPGGPPSTTSQALGEPPSTISQVLDTSTASYRGRSLGGVSEYDRDTFPFPSIKMREIKGLKYLSSVLKVRFPWNQKSRRFTRIPLLFLVDSRLFSPLRRP